MKNILANDIQDPIEKQYVQLQNLVLRECNVPSSFFLKSFAGEEFCFYMFSTSDCCFQFIDAKYQSFTGYLPREHEKGGLDFWFSKVHPGDRRMLSDRILESNQMSKSLCNKDNPNPSILNYRFKKGTSEWIWIQHTVYYLSLNSNGSIDKMLHKLILLDTLTLHNDVSKKPFEVSLNESGQHEGVDTLTKREKQVLKLIAEGFSSKIIAAQLEISINTVETHRRHLLEKLKVKNSMELVRRAFRLFWN